MRLPAPSNVCLPIPLFASALHRFNEASVKYGTRRGYIRLICQPALAIPVLLLKNYTFRSSSQKGSLFVYIDDRKAHRSEQYAHIRSFLSPYLRSLSHPTEALLQVSLARSSLSHSFTGLFDYSTILFLSILLIDRKTNKSDSTDCTSSSWIRRCCPHIPIKVEEPFYALDV